MAKPKPPTFEEHFAQLNAAHTSMLLALTKTLEEAGVISREDYAENVMMVAKLTAREKPGLAADLLEMFAHQLIGDNPKGNA